MNNNLISFPQYRITLADGRSETIQGRLPLSEIVATYPNAPKRHKTLQGSHIEECEMHTQVAGRWRWLAVDLEFAVWAENATFDDWADPDSWVNAKCRGDSNS